MYLYAFSWVVSIRLKITCNLSGWKMDQYEMNFPLYSSESSGDDSSPSTADYLRAKTGRLIQETSAALNAAKVNK